MKVDWVAEVGSAHKGSLSLAYEFIRSFAEAGATTIKFQFGWTEEAQRKVVPLVDTIRFIDSWAGELADYCEDFNVQLLASVWSGEGLTAAIEAGLERIKIGAQLDNPELIGRIYDWETSKKPVIENRVLRTGYNIWRAEGYPALPGTFRMPERFDQRIFGYSDHCHGIEACLLAVARGATYIEKHACLDKSDLATRDTPFSATPQEFERMVKMGNGIRRLLDAGA